MSDSSQSAFIGRQAALLSVVEVGLGSVLHGLKVPMAGQFLSCSQGFLLCRAVKLSPQEEKGRYLAATLSNVAALLKSLSPAGKKITPMLAISAQGLLFSVGTLILGPNFLGCWLGISLLSLWAFLQPLLIAYFLLGNLLIEAPQKLFTSLSQSIPFLTWENFLLVLIFLVIFKVLFCGFLCYLAFFKSEETQRYVDALEKAGLKNKVLSPKRKGWLAFGLQPLFLFSVAISLGFFYFSEAPSSQLFWILLRPFAAGALLYFVSLHLPLERWAFKMQSSRWSRFGSALSAATLFLKSSSVKDSESPSRH